MMIRISEKNVNHYLESIQSRTNDQLDWINFDKLSKEEFYYLESKKELILKKYSKGLLYKEVFGEKDLNIIFDKKSIAIYFFNSILALKQKNFFNKTSLVSKIKRIDSVYFFIIVLLIFLVVKYLAGKW